MDAWENFKKLNLYLGAQGNKGQAASLINANDKILLAVSGGADSICMAHMFWRLTKLTPVKLHIITFNHNLRKAAAKEIKLVENFAKKFNLPFTSVSLDVKGYAKAQGASIETAARTLRYAGLSEKAKQLKFNKVATAHNANDNAETVLMWLIRGAGSAGTSGIPLQRPLAKNITLIRPILPVTRAKINAYVKKNKLAFCTDKSNYDDKFTRNKIRLKIMPEMEKINPALIEQLYSFTRITSRENAFLESLTAKKFAKSVRVFKNKLLLDLTAFFGYNEALRYKLLKMILPDKSYGAHINEIMRRICARAKGVYRFGRYWSFEIRGTHGVFLKNDKNLNN